MDIHEKRQKNWFKSVDMEDLYKNYPDPWRLAVDGHDRYLHILLKIDELFRDANLPRAILDVGCGEGVFTKMLARRYSSAHIYGFDIAKTAVERSLASKEPNSTIFRLDLGKEMIAVPEVDVIILGDVLYYLMDDKQVQFAIAEFQRILSPNGIIIMTEFLRTRKYSNLVAEKFPNRILDTRKIVRYQETPIAGVKNSQLTYRFIVLRRNS